MDSKLRKFYFRFKLPKPQWKNLIIVDRKVFIKIILLLVENSILLAVPSFLRRKILNSYHYDPHAGHMEREKTFARVSERY